MSANLQTTFDFKKNQLPVPEIACLPENSYVFRNGHLKKTRTNSHGISNFHFLQEIPISVTVEDITSDTKIANILDKEESEQIPHKEFLPLYWKSFQILKEYYANPLSALAASRTMLLPHQVQAAIRVVNDIRPRVLIADEVGLGKTIETGLIIKELFLKYNYVKVLLVVPSPLLYQWKSEMKTKFNDDYQILNGAVLKKDPEIVKRENRLLVSVDLAKEERYRTLFLQENFDIVVFDEAHRLRRDQHKVTKAYQFADEISRRCPALLLLSATPFRGKLEEIYYLIHLIDPSIFGHLSMFLQKFNEENAEGLKEKISPVLIRRRKTDVGGFTKRFVRTVRLNLSVEERIFYDETTEYVKREYNRALTSGQRMKSFVMIVFQKLLDSSSYALLQALNRRLEKLQNKYDNFLQLENEFTKTIIDELSEEDKEFFFDDESDEEEFFEEIDPQEMQNEIESLSRLIELGNKITIDSKLLTLEKNIRHVRKNGHKKILIFTQFKSTLYYVANYLKEKYSVGVFHGSMNEKEKELEIEKFFQKTDILILTEAGGEGRNLQVASALFNYDLPWSPLKIEQRIGRIHRFGQKRDVHVINFASKDTVAERVLNILENKIKIFENALGESDALLGALEDELKFHKNFGRFLNEKKSQEEWNSELEKSAKWAKENVGRIDQLLSPEFLDFDMQAFYKVMNDNNKREKTALALKKLFLDYCKQKNISVTENEQELTVAWFSESCKKHKPQKATFHYKSAEENDSLELLALGHPWIDEMFHDIHSKYNLGSHFVVEKSTKSGVYFHLQVTIEMDRPYRRLFSVFVADEQEALHLPSRLTKKQIVSPISFSSSAHLATSLEIAIQNIYPQIIDEVEKIRRRVQQEINVQKNRLQETHQQTEDIISEKLELQKGKAKWFGEQKMISAISRTKNQMRSQEMDHYKKLRDLDNMQNLKISLQVKHSVQFIP